VLTRDSHNPDLQIQQKTKTVAILDFSGGMNIADSPYVLMENQLMEMRNFQLSASGTGVEVRDGVKVMTTNVGTAIPLYSYVSLLGSDEGGILFSSTGAAYRSTAEGTVSALGGLTGDGSPVIEPWGDPQTGYLVASGGKLQYLLGSEITTLEDSPECDTVSKIGGRVVISGADGARVYFSGIGDESNWTIDSDTWTDMDALWVDIGYKSGGRITSLTKIDKDLIIFKTDGIVYKLTGDYPDWHIFEVGHRVKNMNRFSATQFGNDVVFIDESYGIHMLSAISEFGDMRISQFGREVNPQFLKAMGDGASVWNVPCRGELWLKPALGAKDVYVYNSLHKAWGIFSFPLEVASVLSYGRTVYLALKGVVSNGGGNLIYTLDGSVDTDYGLPITASLALRPLPYTNGMNLLKKAAVYVDGNGSVSCSANGHTLMEMAVSGPGKMLSYQGILEDDIRLRLDTGGGKIRVNQVSVDFVEV